MFNIEERIEELSNQVKLRTCDYKKLVKEKLAPVSNAVHNAGSYISSKIKRTHCIINNFNKSCIKNLYKSPAPHI